MLYSPGYTVTQYTGNVISANYISGEIRSLRPFQYGVFECKAKFASQLGAFPAFWCIAENDYMDSCSRTDNEIDFVELKAQSSQPTIDTGIFYHYKDDYCHEKVDHIGFIRSPHAWGDYDIFKCVWTPLSITYYVNNILLSTITNNGEVWYPNDSVHVRLSQQVTKINNSENGIIAPQTSYFDYVRVKQFFLAPEITCPTVICSTGTATLDVLSEATNVSWALTPSTLFVTSSGTGTTANIVKSSVTNGFGTITYSFQMPSGETFTVSKDIWMGPYSSSNYPITGPSSASCSQYVYYSIPNLDGVTSINWVWPSGWTYISGQNTPNLALQTGTTGSGGIVAVQAISCSSPASYATKYTSVTGICGYSLIILPNPASGETTIELVNDDPEKQASAIEWELEVFDQSQVQKTKTAQLKDKKYKLNLRDWKDGIYIIRAKIGDDFISEKLIVKH